jgi:Asp/Glu/hydantoin racemase
MSKRVALLHTSLVFFEREPLLFSLFAQILPDVEIVNIVEDKLLAQVRALGRITPEVTRRMCYYVLAAEAIGVDAIFSTCSSLGPTMNVARELVRVPVVKIDEGMAIQAAQEGQRIGVLATVPTTLQPTIDLIQEKAATVARQIETRGELAQGAFDLLLAGDTARHDDLVAKQAAQICDWADTLVLSQCSMARLGPRLTQETGRPVLTSPQLGIEHLKQVLKW